MRRHGPRDDLQPSLLDRLVDDNPDESYDRRQTLTESQLREALRRDVEWLLNTNCPGALPIPAPTLDDPDAVVDLSFFPRAAESVINFGVSGTMGYSLSSLDTRLLEREWRAALRVFEPRLSQVKVTVTVDRPNQEAVADVKVLIEGEMWTNRGNVPLLLSSDVDMSCAHTQLKAE